MTPELLAMLTPDQQAAWERCQKATPGPCTPLFLRDAMTVSCVHFGVVNNASGIETGRNWLQVDADFDAHARQDLPAALLELAQAKQALAELRAAVDEAPHGAIVASWQQRAEAAEKALAGLQAEYAERTGEMMGYSASAAVAQQRVRDLEAELKAAAEDTAMLCRTAKGASEGEE